MSRFQFTLICFTALLSHISLAITRIVIDPGHGGKDHGASYHNTRESDLTLKVSLQLRDILKREGYQVALTRTTDRHLSLKERTLIARQFSGHLFLSIHANSSDDPRAHGMEVYFENQLPADEESMFLANRENNLLSSEEEKEYLAWPLDPIAGAQHLKGDLLNIVQDLQRNFRIQRSAQFAVSIAENWRGSKRTAENTIQQAPFYVVGNVNMPSALIEVGFVSNPFEAKRLETPQYQKEIVTGLYQAIEQFKEKVDKTRAMHLDWADAN
ncbi:MAG: N-acetylmuramoyl-L-alanine amidase [Bdellovibrionales bacterium]|nr:N-acetylmuramoyl-L-alanine amidase [Bdellovibrionales bacterium]